MKKQLEIWRSLETANPVGQLCNSDKVHPPTFVVRDQELHRNRRKRIENEV